MKSTFLALLFLVFQYTLWVGPNSVWKVVALHQRTLLQKEQKQALLTKNLRLQREIHALKKPASDPTSLQQDYVRVQLGLIKEKERFCEF